MPQRLPLEPGLFNYSFETSLDGRGYLFTFRWNGRDSAWSMDVFDRDGVAIQRGIRLVLGQVLDSGITDDRWPPGLLYMADLSGEGRDASFDDLGTRVILIYFTEAENAELVG